jgi:hypothetical protein
MGTAADAVPELKRRYGVNFPGVFENELPEHLVTVSTFRLDQNEVTNERAVCRVRRCTAGMAQRPGSAAAPERSLPGSMERRPRRHRSGRPSGGVRGGVRHLARGASLLPLGRRL